MGSGGHRALPGEVSVAARGEAMSKVVRQVDLRICTASVASFSGRQESSATEMTRSLWGVRQAIWEGVLKRRKPVGRGAPWSDAFCSV